MGANEIMMRDWGYAGQGMAIGVAVFLIVAAGLLVAYANGNIAPLQKTPIIITAAIMMAIAVGCIVAAGWGFYKIAAANEFYLAEKQKQNPSTVTSSTVNQSVTNQPMTGQTMQSQQADIFGYSDYSSL